MPIKTLSDMSIMLNSYDLTNEIYKGTINGNNQPIAFVFAHDHILRQVNAERVLFINTSERVSL